MRFHPLVTTALLTSLVVLDAPSTTAETDAAPQPDCQNSPAGHFLLCSDARVNLHQFLYHWAREQAPDLKLRGRVPIRDEDRTLEPSAGVEGWERGVAAYEPLIEKALLFDEDTEHLKALARSGAGALRGDPIGAALEGALPAYLETWWPRHAAANRAAIARLQAELEPREKAIAEALARALGSSWPDEPIRVDVVAYASRTGAFTSNDPNHIVVSSFDPDFEGLQGVEILFHEACHTIPLGNPLDRVGPALAEAGLEMPRLWHSILFYISGEVVRQALTPEPYTTYAEMVGLWERGNLGEQGPTIRDVWDLSAPFDRNLERLIARFGAASGPGAADPS